jgi:RNA polymerase sigma factor (sigma-70 family)
MPGQLLERAREGDREAFTELVEPHRAELQAHCYRMLGSLQDAEDIVQETLLAAWLGLPGFEERSSVRTWLYRIATNRCLNLLRSPARRVPAGTAPPAPPPEPTRLGELPWLQPYPDLLLGGLPDQAPGPEAQYESREAISLAFIIAVQLLPPSQRAVLLLRDVLGYRASETAGILGLTADAANGALKRARATLAASRPSDPPPAASARRSVVRCNPTPAQQPGRACPARGVRHRVHRPRRRRADRLADRRRLGADAPAAIRVPGPSGRQPFLHRDRRPPPAHRPDGPGRRQRPARLGRVRPRPGDRRPALRRAPGHRPGR